MRTSLGEPMISPVHEVNLIGENVTRLGNDLNAVLRDGRKVGAARAVDHFLGLATLSGLMQERLG
jgi:hypothetical protein